MSDAVISAKFAILSEQNNRLERELAAAQAENAELKHANAALAKHRDQLTRTCADWEKAMSALAAMVMRYFKSINYRRTGKGDVADALYDKCVKRGDDDRALVAENARLREELDDTNARVLRLVSERNNYRYQAEQRWCAPRWQRNATAKGARRELHGH